MTLHHGGWQESLIDDLFVGLGIFTIPLLWRKFSGQEIDREYVKQAAEFAIIGFTIAVVDLAFRVFTGS